MGRVIAGAVLALIILVPFTVFVVAAARDWFQRRRLDRRDVVIDDEIQRNARDNYRLLVKSVALAQRVLDYDSLMPSLGASLRDELRALVSEFHETEQPKG